MPIRLSGINSGLDTDALVKELVSAYSLKTQKYQKEQTKIEWKQEAWKTLNTKIYGLYTNMSNLRLDSAYNIKKTTVSDPTKATITASGNAVAGTQTLQITQTAQASYITGKRIEGDVTKASTLGELGYDGAESVIEVRSGNGDIHEIKISKDTKISDFVKALKEDAGLNASFDENNGRLFISAKETGEDNDFDLCSTNQDSQDAISLLGLDFALVEERDGVKVFTAAGAAYQDGLDLYNTVKAAENGRYVTTDATTGKEIVNIEQYLKDLLTNNKSAITAKEAEKDGYEATLATKTDEHEELVATKDAYNKILTSIAGDTENLPSEDDRANLPAKVGLDQMVKSIFAGDGELTDEEIKTKMSEYITQMNQGLSDDDKVTLTAEEEACILKALTGNKDAAKTVAGYTGNILEIDEAITEKKAECDAETARIEAVDEEIAEIKANSYGLISAEVEAATTNEAAIAAATSAITALAEEARIAKGIFDGTGTDPAGTERAVKIKGQDARIILNGVIFTSSTNSFSVNGLAIETQAVTNGAISVTTAVDTQGIYDKIKDFLTEYNTVINEITKLYNAESAKDYEPLTDEEKDAMSEEQIEKWEDKIKSALLRRDTSLGTIMNVMVNSMAQTFDVNGEKLSLSSFGIETLGFLNAPENEQYAYHIDGDEDDEKTSGEEDKLMKAIQEKPEQICEFMKKLAESLYDGIHDKMQSTELSSAYKVYNDKELDSQLKKQKELIEKWEDKVAEQEEFYYDKFSQMEVALSKLQSQTNALSGLLGQ